MVLEIFTILFILFMASVCSTVKFYVERQTPKRLEKVIDELLKGAQPSLGTAEYNCPKNVTKTLQQLKVVLAGRGEVPEPLLWELGSAIGEACRQNGYRDGLKIGAKPDDKIRIDISLTDLLQMSWLAHLGFQHMMPNYRGFEVHRFSGEVDAREAARSVAVLECALPKADRPFADVRTQMLARDKMISEWWVPKPALRSVS